MTLKTKSDTIKFAVLQALSELGRPANVSDIYEHIVNKRLYTFNSPQAKKIVGQTGIKPFLVQRGSFQGVAKCYD